MIIRKNNRFIERSILGALSFFKDCLINNDFVQMRGFLQFFDARVKIFFLLSVLLVISFTHSINKFIILYSFCLFLALISKISLKYFLYRSLFFIPLFSLIIALPNIFYTFSPGEVFWHFKIFYFDFNITQEGIQKSLIFVLRVSVSVSFVILVNITTAHLKLLRALKTLGVSEIFVEIMRMTYRYIYLFVQSIENIYLAIKSRTGGTIPVNKGKKIVTWNIAAFWNRTENLNQQVFNAMISRGYKGEIFIFEDEKLHVKDMIFLLVIVMFSLIILFVKI